MAKTTPPTKSKNASRTPSAATIRPSVVPAKDLVRMHQWMVRIRVAEARLWDLLQQPTPRFHGNLHPAKGQEAVSVASVIHLHKEDWVNPTPRELGAHLCRGLPMQDLFAHFANAEQSVTHGRDGGGRLGSHAQHLTPTLGSTASNLAVGAGMALSFKLRKQPQVVVGFFGDGVMATGTFHEVINLVAAQQLPMVLVCNNNGLAFSTPASVGSPVVDLGSRAEAYGIPSITVDGTDVEQVYSAMQQAVARARAGQGGTLVECTTVRLGGFTSETPMLDTIPKNAPDVLRRLEERLLELELLTPAELATVHREAEQEVAQAETHARTLAVAGTTASRNPVAATQEKSP